MFPPNPSQRKTTLRQQILDQLLIVLAAGVVFFTTLGSAALWDEDEPLYASCAQEMLQRGDWVVPWYNGAMFPDKPPLMFWTMMSGFGMFGVNEFGARFWSAVLGIGTALATYHLGRILFGSKVALWAGLIVASTVIFTVSARAATVDSALVFVTTMAVLCFVSGGLARTGGIERPDPVRDQPELAASDFLPAAWMVFVLFYACIAVAVLAKGPIGLLLPAAVIGLFLMIMNDLARADSRQPGASTRPWTSRLLRLVRPFTPWNFLRSLWQMRPFTGIVVVAAIALPWYILVGLRTDGVWLEQFFAKYNLRPFVEPILGHSGPVYYYVPAILIGFFPWSVFAVPTLLDVVRRFRHRDPRRHGTILLLCWAAIFFVFWSICRTKLPHYVPPAYPALALLTACFVDAWIADPTFVPRAWIHAALGITVAAGIGFVAALPVVASIYVPGEELLGLVGLIPIVGGGICLYYLHRGRRRRLMAVFAATSVILLTVILGFAALRVDRHQYAKPLVAEIRQASPGQPDLAGYRFVRESVIFYAKRPIHHCRNADDLRSFLANSTSPFILTTDKHEQEIAQHFPGEFREVCRRPRFLHSGDVVVLAPRNAANAPHLARGPVDGSRQ
ncbi:MAG: glycosyltransferase family 39 protein [Planctomycetota bacterium]